MKLELFDYDLPEQFIAQAPLEPRDSSKLMLLNKHTGEIEHRIFREFVENIHAGDVLVLNNTRVIPARLVVQKPDTGGKGEVLLLQQVSDTDWRGLVGGRNLSIGKQLAIPNSDIQLTILAELTESERLIRFSEPINSHLVELGKMPLPPYIHTELEDNERYQTVYSRHEGSAAAPTAGLHFTPDLLLALRNKGVKFAYCTLHVGIDTFKPVKVDNILDHKIHGEWATLDADNAKIINDAKLSGGRVITVGTTSTRTIESAGILSAGGNLERPNESVDICAWRPVIAFEATTSLYIYPGYQWRVVDAMITNFHLPKSSLMMMISAFSTREHILNAYEVAKQNQYRFFSFGDAMFIS